MLFKGQGHVVVKVSQENKELKEGDGILVPEGMPHQVINIGEAKAVMVWAVAPSLGRVTIHE